MWQVWEYETSQGTQRGVFHRFSDLGGTDVTYYFRRLDSDGRLIVYPNGGHCLDTAAGARLKAARRLGAMPVDGQYMPPTEIDDAMGGVYRPGVILAAREVRP